MASRTFNELYCQAFVNDDSLTKKEKLGKLISLYARLEKEQEMKRQQEISNLECIDEISMKYPHHIWCGYYLNLIITV